MRFAIRFLRARGRILPWREVMNHDLLVGDLRVDECLDEVLHRYVRTAKLLDPDMVVYREKPPVLLDVRLVGMSPLVFTLTRIERAGGVEYAQSWIVSGPSSRISSARAFLVGPLSAKSGVGSAGRG